MLSGGVVFREGGVYWLVEDWRWSREREGEGEDEEGIEAAMACVASASFSFSRSRLLRASPPGKRGKKNQSPIFLRP